MSEIDGFDMGKLIEDGGEIFTMNENCRNGKIEGGADVADDEKEALAD